MPTPDETSDQVFANAMQRQFGGLVDVLVMGHSHLEGVTRFGCDAGGQSGQRDLPRNLVGRARNRRDS